MSAARKLLMAGAAAAGGSGPKAGFSDDWSRGDGSSWDPALWSQTGVDFDVSGGAGECRHIVTGSSASTYAWGSDASVHTDADLLVTVWTPNVQANSSSGVWYFEMRAHGPVDESGQCADGIMFRFCAWSVGTVEALIYEQTNGSRAQIIDVYPNGAPAAAANVKWRLRMRVKGQTAFFRAWKLDTAEPTSWDAVLPLTSAHAAGPVLVSASAFAGTSEFIDDLALYPL